MTRLTAHTGRDPFGVIRLSSGVCPWGACLTSTMDVFMALSANDQGLALARSHALNPGRFVPPAQPLESLQVPNMVDLDSGL